MRYILLIIYPILGMHMVTMSDLALRLTAADGQGRIYRIRYAPQIVETIDER